MKYICPIDTMDIEIVKQTAHFKYYRLWNGNVYKKKEKGIIKIKIGTDEYVIF